MLFKVVPNFEYVCEILKFNHTNKSYCAVRSCGSFLYPVKVGSEPVLNFWKSFCLVSIKMIATAVVLPDAIFTKRFTCRT